MNDTRTVAGNIKVVGDRDCDVALDPLGPVNSAFERVLPEVERQARVRFRGRSPHEFDEARADALAAAWASLVGLQRRGRDPAVVPAAGLARNAIRAARAGRKLSPHPRRRAADPFDWRGPLRPVPLDAVDSAGPTSPIELVGADRRDPARIAALRMDLAEWLDRLEPGRRRLALLLAHGHRAVELARALGLSKGRISQLRRELHRSWLAFHAGPDRPTAASAADA